MGHSFPNNGDIVALTQLYAKRGGVLNGSTGGQLDVGNRGGIKFILKKMVVEKEERHMVLLKNIAPRGRDAKGPLLSPWKKGRLSRGLPVRKA